MSLFHLPDDPGGMNRVGFATRTDASSTSPDISYEMKLERSLKISKRVCWSPWPLHTPAPQMLNCWMRFLSFPALNHLCHHKDEIFNCAHTFLIWGACGGGCFSNYCHIRHRRFGFLLRLMYHLSKSVFFQWGTTFQLCCFLGNM